MAFKIEKVGQGKNLPQGHYIKIGGIDWIVSEIQLDNSGNVCLKLHDPLRKQNQILKPMNLTQLVLSIEGAEVL
jgi:hypothetical protein